MALQSKLFSGLIFCTLFNTQAHANQLMQIDDRSLGVITAKKVITNDKEKSVQLEFTVAQLWDMQKILKQKPDALVLSDPKETNIKYQDCPTININANDIEISKNWLGFPTFYKLPKIADKDADDIRNARCAIIPIETAQAMHSRAKKIMTPKSPPTFDK